MKKTRIALFSIFASCILSLNLIAIPAVALISSSSAEDGIGHEYHSCWFGAENHPTNTYTKCEQASPVNKCVFKVSGSALGVSETCRSADPT